LKTGTNPNVAHRSPWNQLRLVQNIRKTCLKIIFIFISVSIPRLVTRLRIFILLKKLKVIFTGFANKKILIERNAYVLFSFCMAQLMSYSFLITFLRKFFIKFSFLKLFAIKRTGCFCILLFNWTISSIFYEKFNVFLKFWSKWKHNLLKRCGRK
jgi:hypothetical protein